MRTLGLVVHTPRFVGALAALALLAANPGCDGSGTPGEPAADVTEVSDTGDVSEVPDVPVVPYPAARPTKIPLDGQVLIGADLDGNGTPDWLVVDTGAIRTAVDEAFLKDVKNGVGKWDLDLGDGIALEGYEVIAADLATAEDYIGVPLAALIGRDLFLKWWFGLDYRDGGKTYVADTPPAGPPPDFPVATQAVLPWEEIQGYPVADVSIDETPVRLIADTGSGVTLVVRSKVPETVYEKGLSGYVWHTSYGSDPARIVRLPHLNVAGQDLQGTWAVVIPDEYHLKPLFDMMNPKIAVDGFLGYPVYRRFFVGVRGVDKAYDLWRCKGPCGEEPADEWVRAGFEIRKDQGKVVVDMVFSPSDAQGKVQVGDVLLKIGGKDVGDRALDDLRMELRGVAGTTVRLQLTRPGTDGPPLDTEVKVQDLLPL